MRWMSGRMHDHFGRPEVGEDGQERYVLKQRVVRDWIAKLKKFEEEMFVVVHLTGDAPARGSEVASVKSEKGPDGKVGRGIFVGRGLVSFVTTYSKTLGTSRTPSIMR